MFVFISLRSTRFPPAKKLLPFIFLFLLAPKTFYAQPNTWIQKASMPPIGFPRERAVGMAIGNFGYIGTGNDASNYFDGWWQYDPSGDAWLQKQYLGNGPTGTFNRSRAAGFSIGGFGYVGTGYDGSGHNGWWQYDPSTNNWVSEINSGIARAGAVGFSIGGFGYVATGYDGASTSYNDLWRYDPATDSWTQEANFPGAARYSAAGFSIGNYGYVGTGFTGSVCLDDFWRYNPLSNTWIQKASVPGGIRSVAVGFSIGSRGYIATGWDPNTTVNKNDLWEYSPITDQWVQRANFSGGARHGAAAFALNGVAYIGTGYDGSTYYKDLWQYTPAPLNQNAFQRTYGGTNFDTDTTTNLSFASPTNDGGYIIASSTKSFGNGAADVYIIRTNNAGDTLWTKTFGTTADETASSVKQTADGGYIVAGSIGLINSDMLVLKINSSGSIVQWVRGTPGASGIQRANYATEIPGGGYLVAGRADNGAARGTCLIKLNSAGAQTWANSYNRSTSFIDEGFYVEPISQGFYAISGNMETATGSNDAYLIPANPSGSIPSNTFDIGTSSSNDIRAITKETPDGGYIVCGSTNTGVGHGGYDIFLTKINSAGVIVGGWPKFYGGPSDDFARSIVITPLGDYVVGGYTKSFGAGGKDAFMMKINSAGAMLWEKAYGGSLDDSGNSLSQTADGGFILSGQSFSFGAGASDVYVIRTDSIGNSGCHEMAFSFPAPTTQTWNSIINSAGATFVTGPTSINPKSAQTTVGKLCTVCSFTIGKGKTDVKCFGDSTGAAFATPATGVSPFTYSWSTGATTSSISGLTAGTYTVIVTDANSCSAADTIKIIQHPSININVTNDSVNICNGDSTSIGANATGGKPPYVYAWSPAAGLSCTACQNPTANPTITTAYIISITDSNLCVKKDSVHVIVHSFPSVNAGADKSTCAGNPVAIGSSPSSGVNYTWTPSAGLNNSSIANPNANPVSTTTYVVTGTNAAGCSKTDTVIVNIVSSPTVSISYSGPDTICSGTSIVLPAASNGNSYSWSTGATVSSITVVPSATTNYLVSAFIGSCASTASITINVVQTPSVTITGNKTICLGGSTTLAGTGTGNYLWSPGNQTTTSITVSPTATATYSLTVTAAGNTSCSGSDSYTVTVTSSPQITATASSYTLCSGISPDTLIVTNISGGNYVWVSNPPSVPALPNNDTIIVSPDGVGVNTYTVFVSNGSGCSASSTFTINVSQGYSTPAVTPDPANYCIGDSILPFISSAPTFPANIVWTDIGNTFVVIGTTFQPPQNLNQTAGTYTVFCLQGTDKYCLSYPAIVMMNIHSLPAADAGNDITICAGHTAHLNATGGINYLWSPSASLNNVTAANPSADPDSTTFYQVIVTDANNCKNKDSVTVYIDVNDSCGITIYNMITPNGDGNNDVWWIDGIISFPDNTVDIFNRWGNKVWGGINYDNKKIVWSGQNEKGQPLPAGTYYYVIDIPAKRYSGFVELER